MGGLARLDILESPGATLYLTVWMSSHITLHMGEQRASLCVCLVCVSCVKVCVCVSRVCFVCQKCVYVCVRLHACVGVCVFVCMCKCM